jgi:hypothetical protein
MKKRANKILFFAALSCITAPVMAQTVDVTLQCGQTYTINSTVAATAGATYRWLENGSTVTGSAADYTVANKSVGVYTYIRQAKSEGCADWQNSNAFTVEVKNKNDDGMCIAGLMWAKYNVDEPGTFATSIESPGKLYQFNRTKAIDPYDNTVALEPQPPCTEWSPDSTVCPAGWRIPTLSDAKSLLSSTPLGPSVNNGFVYQHYVDPEHPAIILLGPNSYLLDPSAPATVAFCTVDQQTHATAAATPTSSCIYLSHIFPYDATRYATLCVGSRDEWCLPKPWCGQGGFEGSQVNSWVVANQIRCVMD